VDNLLRDAGYEVVMLGADVPADGLGQSARRYEPDVVCFTVTMPDCVRNLSRAIDAVRRQRPTAGFVVGGQGQSLPAQADPDVAVCPRVSEIVEVVDAAIKHAGLN
jgi:methanogenic corrinoid protein MtbC1